MTSPVTLDDLLVRLATTPADEKLPRLQALLDDAWAAVVARTGQTFEEATSTDVVLKVRRGKVRLPQRPVTDIASVTDANDNPLVYTWDGDVTIELSTLDLSWAIEPYRLGIRTVKVTYTHGYTTIPDDVIAVVCQMAGRAFGVSPERTGYNQEQTGPYMVGIGTAAASGAIGMLSEEKAVLDRYTRQGGVTYTGGW